jgi:hypothetical protein
MRGKPRSPIEIPEITIHEAAMAKQCSDALTSNHDILRFADRHPELMSRWDRRAQLPDIARAIAAAAKR